jgi:hypothetical protein
LHVGDVEELFAAEEILAGVRNPALHPRFSGGMLGHRGVGDEAAILRVLEEDAVEAGRVAIGPGDGGREIVDDQAVHDAAEEAPGDLQAVEHGAEILPQADRQERVATAAPRDQQPIDAAPPRGAGVERSSQEPSRLKSVSATSPGSGSAIRPVIAGVPKSHVARANRYSEL